MANNQGSNGPRHGMSTGRNRNTLVNNASRVPAPPVAPQSALQYGDQTAQARYDYLTQLAALRQQRAGIRAQFGEGIAQAKQQQLADVTTAAQNAQERGIIGSSVDAAGRAATLVQLATTRAGLQQLRATGLLGLQQQKLGIQSDYSRSLADIAAQRSTEQQLAAIQNFQNDLYNQSGFNYRQAYHDALQHIRDQRSGVTPRQRNGLTPASPYTNPGEPAPQPWVRQHQDDRALY